MYRIILPKKLDLFFFRHNLHNVKQWIVKNKREDKRIWVNTFIFLSCYFFDPDYLPRNDMFTLIHNEVKYWCSIKNFVANF